MLRRLFSLGLLPKAFQKGISALLFWVSALPSFLLLPVAREYVPAGGALSYWLHAVPWFAPSLLVILLWLLVGDLIRHVRLVARVEQLETPLLEVIFDPDCLACQDEPLELGRGDKLRSLRLGVRNDSSMTVRGVKATLISLRPDTSADSGDVIPPLQALRFKDDLSRNGSPQDVNPSRGAHPVAHVDVIADSMTVLSFMEVQFALPTVSRQIPYGSYRGRIRLERTDGVQTEQDFRIGFNPQSYERIWATVTALSRPLERVSR